MSARSEPRKDELIDHIAALARARLGAKSGLAETFLRRFYANVPLDDLAASPVEDLYGAAIALWQFGKARAVGQAKVRVYTPRLAEHGWTSTHTVVEIVNDDMPFLVNSVIAELNRRELSVHLVIHPDRPRRPRCEGCRAGDRRRRRQGRGGQVLHACRDRRAGLARAADRHRARRRGGARRRARRGRRLAADAVRAAAVIAELADSPPPLPAAEVKTAARLPVVAGGRPFHVPRLPRVSRSTGDGESARTSVVAGSGLGLLRDESFVVFDGLRNLAALPPDVRDFVRQPRLLLITKANRRSTVHRPVHMDAIGIKRFDKAGKVVGQHALRRPVHLVGLQPEPALDPAAAREGEPDRRARRLRAEQP